jgi:hypothetical protein
MANIISIPDDRDRVMNLERERVVPWSVTHGWIYTGYFTEGNHIAQVRRAGRGMHLVALDFDCHGSPTEFGYTVLNSALRFGRSLSESTGFSGNTVIYLSACNTGLTSDYGGPISQLVADGAGCTVYGTKGYMTGTYAEGNEQSYATLPQLPPYPGAQDATGRDVWVPFHPRGLTDAVAGAQDLTMDIPSRLTVRTDINSAPELHGALESIMSTQPVEFPSLRIAPDITINFSRGQEVRILDVYANGGLLKDRITGVTWRVQNPKNLQVLIREALG